MTNSHEDFLPPLIPYMRHSNKLFPNRDFIVFFAERGNSQSEHLNEVIVRAREAPLVANIISK